MHWRIPLVVALALFVAASCSQQPVEPPADEGGATPLFAPNSNANKFVWHFDDAWTAPCNGSEMDVTGTGWGQFMWKRGNHNAELDVFHFIMTFTYNGGTFIYRDVGPDRFWCEDSTCYVAISGRSSASGNADRDEINIGHAVMVVEDVGAFPAISVVFIAGNGMGDVNVLACNALT